MSIAALKQITRIMESGIESGLLEPKVLVVDSPERWDFYSRLVNGIVSKQGLVFAQYLVEGERIFKQDGPFDAYVLDPAHDKGTEMHVKNGLDLAQIIAKSEENPQAVWLLSDNLGMLSKSAAQGFTRIYFKSNQPISDYPSQKCFEADFRHV